MRISRITTQLIPRRESLGLSDFVGKIERSLLRRKPRRHRWALAAARSIALAALLLSCLVDKTADFASGDEPLLATTSSATTSAPTPAEPLHIQGSSIYRWQLGNADASLIEGDCLIRQADQTLAVKRVLIVVDGRAPNVRCRMVAQGSDSDSGDPSTAKPLVWTTYTLVDPRIEVPQYRGIPKSPPDLLAFLPTDDTNLDQTDSNRGNPSSIGVELVQFSQPLPTPDSNGMIEGTPAGTKFYVAGGTRSVEIISRGASSPSVVRTLDRPAQGETVISVRGGVTILIRDVAMQMASGEIMELGTVTLSADRVVAWMPRLTDLFKGQSDLSTSDGELYLEGDIVFRQGDRIIYAQSMYYNVAAEHGMVLDAEAIMTIPEYQGVVRLKSKVLQQIRRGEFVAFDAAVTTSRMGVPRYWLQSERLRLQDRQKLVTDPATGVQQVTSDPFIESKNNFVYAGGIPLLYWPTLATSLDQPPLYLSGIKVGNDSNFGAQLMLDWDLFQLLGIANAPDGVRWDLSTDYLSDRGPAIGTSLRYNLPGFLGWPGPANGVFDVWGIHDSGRDNLGQDRRNLVPEKTNRGRALWRHRHSLPNDYEFIAELGYLSDRNFLEQYLENEWDQEVDHRTALRLRKYNGNQLFDLSAQLRLNEFYSETERLPQLDHYVMGGSFFGDRFTYSAHNRAGYAKRKVADVPVNAAEAVEYFVIPDDIAAEGVIASTKHEISLPVQWGAVKLVPNVAGEAAYFGEGADGNDRTRLTGQAGFRATLPMWKVDPTIQSSLLNVRGLAHKMEWSLEYFFADSNTNLDEIPYYDPLDDNAQEQFRRRFIGDVYGGLLPERYTPRNYAFRQGIWRGVTSPSDVIVDDLQQLRLGLHQRFQTKRGLPGRERITDLFLFDVDTILFPNADDDNFGETLGPTTYDMSYFLGDRVTLLSDGYFDFFDGGLRTISAGVRSSRPGVGDVYLGLLSIEGPVSSTVLRASVDYRFNEKWIGSAGTTYDFGNTGNVGQSLALTRVGESMLLRLGINIDEGRDNVGFRFAIEPRFWPRPKLGRIGGKLIPPPGIEGLE